MKNLWTKNDSKIPSKNSTRLETPGKFPAPTATTTQGKGPLGPVIRGCPRWLKPETISRQRTNRLLDARPKSLRWVSTAKFVESQNFQKHKAHPAHTEDQVSPLRKSRTPKTPSRPGWNRATSSRPPQTTRTTGSRAHVPTKDPPSTQERKDAPRSIAQEIQALKQVSSHIKDTMTTWIKWPHRWRHQITEQVSKIVIWKRAKKDTPKFPKDASCSTSKLNLTPQGETMLIKKPLPRMPHHKLKRACYKNMMFLQPNHSVSPAPPKHSHLQRGNSYFYNLWIFVTNKGVCTWKAFPA